MPSRDSKALTTEPEMSAPTSNNDSQKPSDRPTTSSSLLATLVSALLNITIVFAGKHNIKLAEAWKAVLSNLSEAVETVEARLKEMGMELPADPKVAAKAEEPKTPVRSRLPIPKSRSGSTPKKSM